MPPELPPRIASVFFRSHALEGYSSNTDKRKGGQSQVFVFSIPEFGGPVPLVELPPGTDMTIKQRVSPKHIVGLFDLDPVDDGTNP